MLSHSGVGSSILGTDNAPQQLLPRPFYSAAASMASTAPLLLLLLLQQIPNFLLSDAARLRHSTVPLYSNFRKYAHPLDVKGGIITEKKFPSIF